MKLSDAVGSRGPVAFRLATAVIAGFAAAIPALMTGRSHYAPAIGWITTAAVYLLWTWAVTWRMDASATREHAVLHERDGTRRLAHAIVVVASLVSLAGVGYLLYATSGEKPNMAAGTVGGWATRRMGVCTALVWAAVVTAACLPRLGLTAAPAVRAGLGCAGRLRREGTR